MRLSRKEFAKKARCTPAQVAVQISRGKIVEEDGKIDPNNEANKLWLEGRKLIGKRKGVKGKVRVPSATDPERQKQRTHLLTLEAEKRKADVELKTRQAAMLEFKEQRLLGEYVPLHLAKHLFTTHFKSVHMSHRESLEKSLMRLSTKYKMSSNDIAAERKMIIEDLNRSVMRAEVITDRELDGFNTAKTQ